MSPRLREVFWVVLYPLAVLWALVAKLRRHLASSRKRYQPPAHTLVVGNLHSGGSGKTPLVAAIADHFQARSPAIVSRGYRGRLSRQGARVDGQAENGPALYGDEPWLLYKRTQAPVFIGARRSKALAAAAEQTRAGLFVLDDAFQNFSFRHDTDLVLVSTNRALEDSFTLPLGDLREPLSAAAAAHAVVLVQGTSPERHQAWQAFFGKHFPGLAVFEATPQLQGFWDAQGPVELDPKTRWGAFCGIAGPERFFSLLAPRIDTVFEKAYRDHHRYRDTHIAWLIQQRCATGADRLVTTEKDWYKAAPGFSLRGESLVYARMGYLLEEPFWRFLHDRVESL